MTVCVYVPMMLTVCVCVPMVEALVETFLRSPDASRRVCARVPSTARPLLRFHRRLDGDMDTHRLHVAEIGEPLHEFPLAHAPVLPRKHDFRTA